MPSNEALNMIRNYIDAVNRDNSNQVETLLADNVQWSSPAGDSSGRQGTRDHMQKWFNAFPDLKLEPVNVLGDAHMAAAECRLVGTQRGMLDTDFGQFPASNHRINVNIVNMIKMQNGKISEIHVFYDSALIMKQLGVQQTEQRAA
jgi:steroid delta-isomerase-like uncharacterized protein